MMLPVTIAGGGLAGLALGIGLRRHGVPVTVFESGRYPRHRVCGEFITGLSTAHLDELGLHDCFRDVQILRTSRWFYRGRPVRTYTLPVPAIGISRYSLDNRMAEQLRLLGGVVHEKQAVPESSGPGRIQATGRNHHRGGYTGLKGHWSDLKTGADLEVHLGNRAYVGVSPVEDGYANVCGLFNSIASGRFNSPLDRFHATLGQHGLSHLSERLRGAKLREGSLCSVTGLTYPGKACSSQAGLGDSNRMVPPFTGHGMAIAMESAARVLPVLVEYSSGSCSWNDYIERSSCILSRQFDRRRRFAGTIHPFVMIPQLQAVLVMLSRLRLLPFRTIYRMTH